MWNVPVPRRLHVLNSKWSKYRLGIPRVAMHFGLTWLEGIPIVLQKSLTVPSHSPNGRQLPAIRLSKATVKGSKNITMKSGVTNVVITVTS